MFYKQMKWNQPFYKQQKKKNKKRERNGEIERRYNKCV